MLGKAWEDRPADEGFRITAPRRAVMSGLRSAEALRSARDILERAEGVHAELGLTTVYGTVGLLQDLELVGRVHHSGGCRGYGAASPGRRREVVCQVCGRTMAFAGSTDLAALARLVEQGTGYGVEGDLLQLFGLCPACQEVDV